MLVAVCNFLFAFHPQEHSSNWTIRLRLPNLCHHLFCNSKILHIMGLLNGLLTPADFCVPLEILHWCAINHIEVASYKSWVPAFLFANSGITLEDMAIARTILFYSWDWSEEGIDWWVPACIICSVVVDVSYCLFEATESYWAAPLLFPLQLWYFLQCGVSFLGLSGCTDFCVFPRL